MYAPPPCPRLLGLAIKGCCRGMACMGGFKNQDHDEDRGYYQSGCRALTAILRCELSWLQQNQINKLIYQYVLLLTSFPKTYVESAVVRT